MAENFLIYFTYQTLGDSAAIVFLIPDTMSMEIIGLGELIPFVGGEPSFTTTGFDSVFELNVFWQSTLEDMGMSDEAMLELLFSDLMSILESGSIDTGDLPSSEALSGLGRVSLHRAGEGRAETGS